MSIYWCCPGFHANHTDEPGRGISIVGGGGANPFEFVARAIDRENDAVLVAARFSFPISMQVRAEIRFCPWCGANLYEHYRGANALPGNRGSA
jgi:hypothetical protein